MSDGTKLSEREREREREREMSTVSDPPALTSVSDPPALTSARDDAINLHRAFSCNNYPLFVSSSSLPIETSTEAPTS